MLKLSGSVGDCGATRSQLLGAYGEPVEKTRMSTTWLDRTKGNEVSFMLPFYDLDTGTCLVVYRPLPSGSGL